MTIKLRDKVRDEITGFVGTVIGRTEWLNGCVQYAVKPRVDKDGKIGDSEWIDEQQLVVIEPDIDEAESPRGTGGPMADAPRC